jgi:hypothetical protein
MKTQMASLVSWINAQHERMMACLGSMEVMDLEANPEEKESEVVQWEVLKEHAAVKPVGGLRKQHRGRRVPSEAKGTDLEKLWIPEEIDCCWEKLDQGQYGV